MSKLWSSSGMMRALCEPKAVHYDQIGRTSNRSVAFGGMPHAGNPPAP